MSCDRCGKRAPLAHLVVCGIDSSLCDECRGIDDDIEEQRAAESQEDWLRERNEHPISNAIEWD